MSVHVLVQHGVTWLNVLNDVGKGDIARGFGVETIPVNVLVWRDGMVLGVELGDPELEAAINRALASPSR